MKKSVIKRLKVFLKKDKRGEKRKKLKKRLRKLINKKNLVNPDKIKWRSWWSSMDGQ